MIRHTIRSKDGGTKEISLTPLKAIRNKCLECVYWSASEVKRCTSKLCSLHPYRFGKVPGHKGKGNVNNFIEK
jgi:hypothetical protein